MKRSFLFLQGVCSPFFRTLGKALRSDGYAVHKVNFTIGDSVSWSAGGARSYRRSAEGLPAHYSKLFDRYGVSDIVLFGDCRPIHRPAVELAKARGIRTHVFEEGYFRPYWVTLERGGVNAYSSLPKDPRWYRESARSVPKYGNGDQFTSPFWVRATHDVLYNFWAGLNPLFYPGYVSHVPYSPASEYWNYVRRSIKVVHRQKHDAETIKTVVERAANRPYYLLPLQLSSDAQIRHHSRFRDMEEVLKSTLRSFALHAPLNSILVIKNHPLDPGFTDYGALVGSLASEFAIEDRVVYLESGHLPTLLSHTSGVVTVNSTVGGSALVHDCPTIALGRALYDLPGLTFQGSLDEFWRGIEAPDKSLFRDFRNVVIHTTQVNGGFYCRRGIDMAVRNSIPVMTASESPLEDLVAKHYR